MNLGDLTTLDHVTEWLNAGGNTPYPAGDNALLQRLITSCSRWVESYLSRSISPADRVETYNGTGTQILFLRNRPVVSVSSVVLNNTTIAKASQPLATGWMNDDTRVYVNGYLFTSNFQNVTVSYVSGYQTSDVLMIATPLSVSSFPHPWNADRGVVMNGAIMLKVTSAPASGQYALIPNASTGVYEYVFNAADVGQLATFTYGFTPEDIEQVIIETVGERFKTRTRIGQSNVNLGNGQVITFSLKDFNDASKTCLNQYINTVPV
jgi:hypothetical protein